MNIMSGMNCGCHYLFVIWIIIIQILVCICGNNLQSDGIEESINTLKDTVKDIKKPEDIPLVADWLENCKTLVSKRDFREIKRAPSKMYSCINKNINLDKLRREVNDSMERGELDLVFKKYCGKREQVMECIDDVLENVMLCMDDEQLIALNMTRRSADNAIDFICFENGDRIALFMAEEGIECVKNQSKKIESCIKKKIPEVEQAEDELDNINMDRFLINDENCKKVTTAQGCIVQYTTLCKDPTPANILDSLIKAALKDTPCAPTSGGGFNSVMPHILMVIASGLLALHILL